MPVVKPVSNVNLVYPRDGVSEARAEGYRRGSYRIATAPESNSKRFTSCKST
jgi:hypothetical protein